MARLPTYEQALDKTNGLRRHLLIGNGFSIACRPDIFSYDSLFEEARKEMPPELLKVFETLRTTDFEVAIRGLQTAASLVPTYAEAGSAASSLMLEHADFLKELLVQSLAKRHPNKPGEIENERYGACRNFLSPFLGEGSGNVYTLNYDLLLYWALMHRDADGPDFELHHDDGFRKDDADFDAPYVVWHGETRSHGQRLHYLHGALHLFDGGHELQKYTWVNTGVPLIEQTRAELSRNYFPLFVSEADSNQKLSKIQHSAYLHHSYKSYVSMLMGGRNTSLFVYGHSFAANDDHIIERIARSQLGHLFVSLYGDPDSPGNQEIRRRADRLQRLRGDRFPLSIEFYDAESAHVWG